MSEVLDRVDAHRFVLAVDGHEAHLVYRREGDRLELLHTEVPQELAGRGVGGRLVAAALDSAAAAGATLVPYCPFARSWLERHPDAASAGKIDWPSE
jgi:predicted GNAT family acetyltransferase